MRNQKNYHLKTLIMYLIILFSLPSLGFAVQNELLYKQITTKDGLQDDNTRVVEQDAQGYMWFGTRSGLTRYDGISFKTFTFDPHAPDGLSGNDVLSLHNDKFGNLWIGTINGLCRFETRFDKPLQIPIRIGEKVLSPSVSDISSDDAGIIWFSTFQNGFFSYNPSNDKFAQYSKKSNAPNGLLSNTTHKILCASDSLIWIGTNKGLNSFDQNSKTFKTYTHTSDRTNSISDNYIVSLAEGQTGDLWIGTRSGGLNRLNRENGQITVYKHDPDNKNTISSNDIQAIHYNQDNTLWLGSGVGTGVLHKLDIATGRITKYKISEKKEGSYILADIRDIFVDRTGIVWIAQLLGGINYFDPNWKNYEHYLINEQEPKGWINAVYGILPVSKSQLWASTFNGLVLFDRKKGIIKSYTNSFQWQNGNALKVKDQIWTPTRLNGIVRLDPQTNIITNLAHNPGKSKSLSSNYINILLQDNAGIVWAGSSNNGGLDRIDPNTDKIKSFKHIPGNPNSLPDNSIYALFEKDSKHLWVGSNSGLALFNKEKESFKTYVYNHKDSTSISSNQVSYIMQSTKGVLWVATYGGGLNRFDPESESFIRYTSQKNNIPDNTVYSFLEDNNGNLWISTARGIARFLPDKETYDFIIPIPSFYKPAKIPDGELAFSGPPGILIFDPEKMKFNTHSPKISLANFAVNDKIKERSSATTYKYILNSNKNIELKYFQNDLSFEFLAAHYSNSEKNKLAVNLEGYDNRWRNLGSTHQINYTNLDPGQYILRVKAASAYDVWTEKPLELSIIINHPWWKTWWAYFIYSVLIIGLLVTIRQFELDRREEKINKQFLEEENKRKSKELEEARQLQLSMLPKEVPQLPHLDIAVYMQTATEVGGDYYDFSIKKDGSLNIALGDATGHGMKAGIMVSSMKSIFTTNAAKMSIKDFFTTANNGVKSMQLKRMMMGFAMLNLNKNEFKLINAGMPPIFLFRKSSGEVEEITEHGMPIGAMKLSQYSVIDGSLKKGDVLLLMSDGLPELQNDEEEMYGYERLRNGLKDVAEKDPEEIITFLKNEGKAWNSGRAPDDDVTFAVIKVK